MYGVWQNACSWPLDCQPTKLSVCIVLSFVCLHEITLFLNCVILRHNDIYIFYGCLIELYGDSDFEIAFFCRLIHRTLCDVLL